jgi:hypothetical protein
MGRFDLLLRGRRFNRQLAIPNLTMIDPTIEVKKGREAETGGGITRDKVLQAIVFGLIFGFLLQKGGVAKYHVLVGVLLLQDFTVIKVMASAIVVGMVGLFALNRAGKIEFKLKPTRYGPIIVGGLIFGCQARRTVPQLAM